MIAMPGMVNAHCHSPANLVRGMMPSKPLEIWRAYYRASLRDMRDEDFYASALLGGMEMLKNGATTVLDHFRRQRRRAASWAPARRFRRCAISDCAMSLR